MKTFFWVCVFLSAICAAQQISVQTEHEQYLQAADQKHFLQGESVVLNAQEVAKDEVLDISVKIVDNKFSLLARMQEKSVVQEGIVTLEKKPGLVAITTLSKSQEFKFAFEYQITPNKFSSTIELSAKDVLEKEPLDAILMGLAARTYPSIKANLGTDKYKACIMMFIHAEKPLLYLLLKSIEKQELRGFNCPNCDWSYYYSARRCTNCGSCFSPNYSQCQKCWSKSYDWFWKSCSRCGCCYK